MSFPSHRNLPYLEQNNGPVLGGKDTGGFSLRLFGTCLKASIAKILALYYFGFFAHLYCCPSATGSKKDILNVAIVAENGLAKKLGLRQFHKGRRTLLKILEIKNIE